jgi:colicin import membrane protein
LTFCARFAKRTGKGFVWSCFLISGIEWSFGSDLKKWPLSMDIDSGRGSERQTLAAEGRDHFSETVPEPTAARSYRRFLIMLVTVSLIAHGCFVLAILLLDQSRDDPSKRAQEITVELVPAPPPLEPKPATPEAGKKSAPPPESAQAPAGDPQQKPESAANSKPANEAKSDSNPDPHPEAKPAAPQKPEMQAKAAVPQDSKKGGKRDKARQGTKTGPGEPAPPTHKDMPKDLAKDETAREQSPAAKPEGGPAGQDGGSKNQWGAPTGLTLPFDTGPDRFRAVAVPLPDEGGDESMSYKVIVFGLLARFKHFPESAIQRGAKGIAVIGFVLDDSGGVVSVSLLRSSGDADLDAESVALVNRAAPFPVPPPGAERSFAAEIAFGMGH